MIPLDYRNERTLQRDGKRDTKVRGTKDTRTNLEGNTIYSFIFRGPQM